jgi:hypothetical protein
VAIHGLLRAAFAGALVASLMFIPKAEASAAVIVTVGGTPANASTTLVPMSGCHA